MPLAGVTPKSPSTYSTPTPSPQSQTQQPQESSLKSFFNRFLGRSTPDNSTQPTINKVPPTTPPAIEKIRFQQPKFREGPDILELLARGGHPAPNITKAPLFADKFPVSPTDFHELKPIVHTPHLTTTPATAAVSQPKTSAAPPQTANAPIPTPVSSDSARAKLQSLLKKTESPTNNASNPFTSTAPTITSGELATRFSSTTPSVDGPNLTNRQSQIAPPLPAFASLVSPTSAKDRPAQTKLNELLARGVPAKTDVLAAPQQKASPPPVQQEPVVKQASQDKSQIMRLCEMLSLNDLANLSAIPADSINVDNSKNIDFSECATVEDFKKCLIAAKGSEQRKIMMTLNQTEEDPLFLDIFTKMLFEQMLDNPKLILITAPLTIHALRMAAVKTGYLPTSIQAKEFINKETKETLYFEAFINPDGAFKCRNRNTQEPEISFVPFVSQEIAKIMKEKNTCFEVLKDEFYSNHPKFFEENLDKSIPPKAMRKLEMSHVIVVTNEKFEKILEATESSRMRQLMINQFSQGLNLIIDI